MQLSQRNFGIVAIVSAIVVPELAILLITMTAFAALLPRLRIRLAEDVPAQGYQSMLVGNHARVAGDASVSLCDGG
jgi:hypothetical protein